MSENASSNAITSEAALFGFDPTPGIVAVEPDYTEGVWLYRRDAEGLHRERAPYKPWILLTKRPDFDLPGADYTNLAGEGYSVLAEFPTQDLYREARFRIRDEHIENLTYPGGAKMALIRSGQTLFKGMTFGDIVRFQFDIETDGLDPMPENNRILLIAVADNRGLLELIEGDEPEILERFAALVRDRDPDVLEGHNVFGFDLPFIQARAQRHNVRLAIGRDGSEPRQGQERNYAIGGVTRPFIPIYIHGRHVLDTYLIVQRFDWAKGSLSSYGLKECARQFGFAEAERVELPRAEIARIYREDPALVLEYARQDVVETGKLAELITPVEFYQTQMVPDNYGQVAVTGNGEKINALFVRAYLAAGRAVARQRASRPYAGGYTEVRTVGVLDRVVKADVESLYPSLMLTHRIAPAEDTLGLFLPALKELTQRRLEAKRKAAVEDGKHYWDGLQNSYKVLINSFYGYLGGPFCWNDYDAAERVTELGRELVVDVANRMEASGSHIIEIDTDGVYFVPPPEVQGEEAERDYIKEIGGVLPEGIRLAFDGRFATMLSVKTKNYVLVTYEGRKIYKGASLRSRADERYGRHFLAKAVDCLLEHDLDGIKALYAQTIDDLKNRRVPINDLVRRERVTEKTFQSEQKKRAAKVAEGVPVGEYVMVYERTDGSLGLLEDYAGDENPKYYMDKLYKFAKRLEEAFGGAFDRYIPKPTAQGIPHQAQETLDLF
ncbi:MAG TPA: 3'-5' exonuclease [Chthonomonadaceae bacterium]|nr:3'-5' exonuclease [Chthonomonadaceae bacterium]